MVLCADVHYEDGRYAAAGVLFRCWTDQEAEDVIVVVGDEPSEYTPGEFYRRELPCLLALLERLPEAPNLIIVDGHVWLGESEDGSPRKGLGAHLHVATGIPVVGVAKRGFAGATPIEVFRGESSKPLHVSAAGCDAKVAASQVASMHGPFRIPTLLKLADRACRDSGREPIDRF